MGLFDRFYQDPREAVASQRHKAIRRRWADPLTVRHWHNPADPIQAARIEAAAAKRERRADKLHDWACRSQHFQTASRHLILN